MSNDQIDQKYLSVMNMSCQTEENLETRTNPPNPFKKTNLLLFGGVQLLLLLLSPSPGGGSEKVKSSNDGKRPAPESSRDPHMKCCGKKIKKYQPKQAL